MSEERLKALENNHLEIKDAIKQLADSYSTVIERQTKNDISMAKIMSKIDSRFSDDKVKNTQYELTLRNIDDNVRNLALKIAEQPMERNRELTQLLSPLWSSIHNADKNILTDRLHNEEQRVIKGKELKIEIRKEARSHLSLIYILFLAILTLTGIVYNEARHDIDLNTSKSHSIGK